MDVLETAYSAYRDRHGDVDHPLNEYVLVY